MNSNRRASLVTSSCVILTLCIFHARLAWSANTSSERVRLDSGRLINYRVDFDLNSIKASVRISDGLIALTSAGVLVRFELPEVRVSRTRVDYGEVLCLGRGKADEILAGFADGRVCRIDAKSLDAVEVARFEAEPVWVGWAPERGKRPAGYLGVTMSRPFRDKAGQWQWPEIAFEDLAAKPRQRLKERFSAFLLDRSGRLWLGADKGEWGGAIHRIDLADGTETELAPLPSLEPERIAYWGGIYGFLETKDGGSWAFGGTSHMGFNEGYITRIDSAKPERLFVTRDPVEGAEPKLDQPRFPITQVVEDRDGLMVFSYSQIFRVDEQFKAWKHLGTLKIRYRFGRPDAVGAYPSIKVVHPPVKPGEPYLLGTLVDGYVAWDGAKAVEHKVPGVLGASQIVAIKKTTEGTLLVSRDRYDNVWRKGAKGWEVVSLAPPFERAPGDPNKDEEDGKALAETHVMEGRQGELLAVSSFGFFSTGTRVTARLRNGKWERLGVETSDLSPTDSFLTPDGAMWNANGELFRFENGRWQRGPSLPQRVGTSGLRAVGTNGPPWLLHEGRYDRLWRLDPDKEVETSRLVPVELTEGGQALRIYAALPSKQGELLLATNLGLRAYSIADSKVSRSQISEPPSVVTRLAFDAKGRLWLGGKGLWMLDRKAKVLESFGRVTFLGGRDVSVMAADPMHDDGMIVAFQSGGVLFLQAGLEH